MNRLRTFYFLVATQTLSIIGSRMTGIAVGIRVFTDTGDTAPLLLNVFRYHAHNVLMASHTSLR